MTDHHDIPTTRLDAIILASAASGGFIGPDGDDMHIPPIVRWLRWRIQDILVSLPRPQSMAAMTDRLTKPQPDPWRSALAIKLGRAVADRAIGLHLDGTLIGGATGKAHADAAAGFVGAFVDDYCGTPPRHKLPLPHGIEFALTHDEQVLIAGQLAAGARIGGVPALNAAAEQIAGR